MLRLLAGLLALVCLSPVALFAVAPPSKLPVSARQGRKTPIAVSPSADFQISALSEIRLNGRLCKFKDVPNNAVITKIEVDPDTKDVVTVHFSARK